MSIQKMLSLRPTRRSFNQAFELWLSRIHVTVYRLGTEVIGGN